MQECGGECGSTTEYYKIQRKNLEENYREWLIDSGNLKEKIEKKSKSKCKTGNTSIQPTIRSFSALEID